MSDKHTRIISRASLACLAALLAAPLTACSDRSAERETAQADTQGQPAAQQEQQAQADGQQREIAQNDATYTDGYSQPREAWTGGANARDARFEGSADSDARALAELEEMLASRDDFGEVEVAVEEGVAHLAGEVESEADRKAAAEAAMAVQGVAAVRNDLQVGWKAD